MDLRDAQPLQLPFKGTREYLHGSDIVPALLALTGPVRQASFQFHRPAVQPLAAREVDEAALAALREAGQLHVLMVFAGPQGRRHVAVVPQAAPVQPIARIPYDEAAIVAASRIEGRTVVDDEPGRGSFIERTLALHKHLLNTVVGPSAWLFSRLDLSHAPVQPRQLRLSLLRTLGDSVCLSALEGDGQALGSLYFTRRTP